ncbi:MAG TPA: hypothetical protein VGM98_06560 [Schlesneria sp.]
MGFTVYYRSTEPMESDKAAQIRFALQAANEGRTWLSCEPAHLFLDQEDGHLLGGSKPNFTPHPDDIASAEAQGLPDGTLMDVLRILCDISEEHGVDWALSHDHDPGPIGFVREGTPDSQLVGELEQISELGGLLEELESEFDTELLQESGDENFDEDEPPSNKNQRKDDDNDPPILKLFPGDS